MSTYAAILTGNPSAFFKSSNKLGNQLRIRLLGAKAGFNQTCMELTFISLLCADISNVVGELKSVRAMLWATWNWAIDALGWIYLHIMWGWALCLYMMLVHIDGGGIFPALSEKEMQRRRLELCTRSLCGVLLTITKSSTYLGLSVQNVQGMVLGTRYELSC